MGRNLLLFVLAIVAFAAGGVLAQQPVQPLPKMGGCTPGHFSSGDYFMPSKGGKIGGMIEMTGGAARSASTRPVATASAAPTVTVKPKKLRQGMPAMLVFIWRLLRE